MRFYAIVGSMQVMSMEHATKFNNVVSFFTGENKTSLSAQEAREFFHKSATRVNLYQSYEQAMSVAIQDASRRGWGHNEEFYPHKHKFYATPIYTVELPDDFHLSQWSTFTVEFTSDARKLARELGFSANNVNVKEFHCEKKDVLAIVAVDMPHPNFKKHHHIQVDEQKAREHKR